MIGVGFRGAFAFPLHSGGLVPLILLRFLGLILILTGCVSLRAASNPAGITNVTLSATNILISGEAEGPTLMIFEVEPFESMASARTNKPIAVVTNQSHFSILVARIVERRDRGYSSFVAVDGTNTDRVLGGNRFVEDFVGLERNEESFPVAASKKGLQIQMTDDALALGVKHAALNLNLSSLVELINHAGVLQWQRRTGEEFFFNKSRVEALDAQVKKFTDAGVVVTFILLAYESSHADLNKVMLHPRYDRKAPNHLSAFNTANRDGVRYFSACIEFLAERYSRTDRRSGRAVNFIVGNEINSHWFWYNMGRVSMEELGEDYLRTVRICNTAMRNYSAAGRVYLSLEHHWNIRYPGGDDHQAFAGRKLIDFFNERARAHGNFDWHLAFHPYPENLFECRTWNDKTATFQEGTPRITFKNLEMLTGYLRRPELLYRGEPRRVILSEQGFHSPDRPEGELLQAAAYAYAYYRIANLPGIDSFILHRQVDHPAEGGLHLGLWRPNAPGSPSGEKLVKKQSYEVFRHADMPDWEQAFAFALPVIGIKSWDEIRPRETVSSR
jgi:hypothetical protein